MKSPKEQITRYEEKQRNTNIYLEKYLAAEKIKCAVFNNQVVSKQKIDDNIYNKLYSIYGDSNKIDINKFNEISILKFNMYKGKLYNMCDLTYVANALLTGDDGGNAITVVGVSDDD